MSRAKRINRCAGHACARNPRRSLAWLSATKPWIAPIPGTTKLHRLDENTGAAAMTLTDEDLRDIERAASDIPIHGARYPDAMSD